MKQIVFFLFLVCSLVAQETNDVKPNMDVPYEKVQIEAINKHLQENYNLQLSKKFDVILTGEMTEEFDKQLKNRTYTDFKIQF
jgi:ATP adenylyltransferase/5',5'''-P-1,P-4-tetraphosphate phosphorylase II